MKFKKIAAIIAAYNEEKYIKTVCEAVKKQGVHLVIVVDDGSKDSTVSQAVAGGAVVLKHISNLGKGGAMKTGAAYAMQEGADALIFLDGDGQHSPGEIPKFVKALEKKEFIIGARKFNKNMPALRKFGKWLTSTIVQVLYQMDITDCLNGYRAVRASAYPNIIWRSKDYCVEAEMIAWAGKTKVTYKEVTTKTIYHDKHKGVTPLHGFPIIWNLFMWRFQKRKGKKRSLRGKK